MTKKLLDTIIGKNPQVTFLVFLACTAITGSSGFLSYTGNEVVGRLEKVIVIIQDIDNSMWTKDHKHLTIKKAREKGVIIPELSDEDFKEIDEKADQMKLLRRFKEKNSL